MLVGPGPAIARRLAGVRRWPGLASLSTGRVRCSERPNIQKPQHPAFDRLKLLALSAPSHPHPHPTTATLNQACPLEREMQELMVKEQPSPLEVLYGEELRQWMERSRMVGLYHANVMTYYPARAAFQNARRLGMELKQYNLQSGLAGLTDTRWENLLHFWYTNVSNQYLTFGHELHPKQLLTFEKKSPFLFLIGAVIEGRILDRGQVQELTALPPLDALRGELCSILQMPARKTSSLVGRHSQVLSQHLEQYMKDQSGSDDP
ncbi:hypothetical protein TCAL_01800 [Tigriopus californicus]|uniref:Large ribosomal subunit protein uL10m n=1 Tax=Tigriopus californicus TaxID=6832 RepID=A0A553N8L7_TIGCA|nr:large ribosomal subunit protein uL10-like [Tigriopus californicus]TRY61765.1 hypothetical protein TCAL_01800 [Tigriopus californicus]|eukprot:TCALIF_01800-PA protein Name:"Similar to mRpL10 39S ribosomal protein L10, mitochondrial (Drosophila melanogaster)" AED:0.05 eAED:0.05 QI:336/1/1/1/1/1/4/74/262